MFCGYVADAMVSTGLSSLGYQYINIGTSSRIHIQIFCPLLLQNSTIFLFTILFFGTSQNIYQMTAGAKKTETPR